MVASQASKRANYLHCKIFERQGDTLHAVEATDFFPESTHITYHPYIRTSVHPYIRTHSTCRSCKASGAVQSNPAITVNPQAQAARPSDTDLKFSLGLSASWQYPFRYGRCNHGRTGYGPHRSSRSAFRHYSFAPVRPPRHHLRLLRITIREFVSANRSPSPQSSAPESRVCYREAAYRKPCL